MSICYRCGLGLVIVGIGLAERGMIVGGGIVLAVDVGIGTLKALVSSWVETYGQRKI
jgi:hypothetical protein